VLSVYTLFETDKYQKYIIDHKLDWINTYDGTFQQCGREMMCILLLFFIFWIKTKLSKQNDLVLTN
jgi:hypothetical protein